MKTLTAFITKHRVMTSAAIVIFVTVLVLGVWQFLYVSKAHSSFENYYKFRGCSQLLSRSDTEATCKTTAGNVIKIVEFKGRWYLDGDLPVCWFGKSVCF
jgi:hypothetical protein